MRRSATSVWKVARANLDGLPSCPDDMAEPQYAATLFDPQCHVRIRLFQLALSDYHPPVLLQVEDTQYYMAVEDYMLPTMLLNEVVPTLLSYRRMNSPFLGLCHSIDYLPSPTFNCRKSSVCYRSTQTDGPSVSHN